MFVTSVCRCGALKNNAGHCPRCGSTGHISVKDPVKKLRRKIENRLRNSEDEVIIKTAAFLGVR